MSNSYLLLPERLARFPITLEEAAFKFGVGNLPAIDRASLSLERRMKYGYYSRRAVLLNLMGGDLHAFVQDASIGAWYRIPKAYWLGDGLDVSTAMERPHLPELLEHRSFFVTPDDSSIVGQPIVVWQDDVERLVEVMGALGAAMNDPTHSGNATAATKEAASDVAGDEQRSPWAKEERIAAILDAAGRAKRGITSADVEELWDGQGNRPAVKTVISFMTDKPKGRRAAIV